MTHTYDSEAAGRPACLLERDEPRPGAPQALLDPHVQLRAVRDDAGRVIDFVCAEANAAAAEYLGLDHAALVGATVLAVLPQRAATEMLPLLTRTMETGQPFVLDDYPYPSEVFACERRYDVRVVRVADGIGCTWCDVTQRFEIEECLRRRVSELDSIHRIAQFLAVRHDLPSALAAAGHEIDDLFGARSSRILVLPEGDAGLSADRLETAGEAGAGATPCETAVIARALETRAPARVDRCGGPGRRLLGVPLVSRAQLLGVLTVVREPEAPRFSAHEVAVAESVADAVAAAVENERQRLARELHDSVTQTLYSANLIAEVLPDMSALDAAEGLEGLDKLRRLMRTALCEMRTLLFELRPETLASAPLESLLERLGDVLTGHDGTVVDIAVDEGAGLPVEVKLAFYRVAQEALTNISKHAHAGRVAVALVGDALGARLTVRDDGCGFEPAAVRAGSMGLRIMRERAEEMGAALEIRSDPVGGGTEVSLDWRRSAVCAAGE